MPALRDRVRFRFDAMRGVGPQAAAAKGSVG